MPPKAQKEPAVRRITPSVRSVLYALAFGWLFLLTGSELGLVSQQLHRGGNNYANYGSKQYKHALGLLLFSCLSSLLVILSHPWLSVPFVSVCSFVLAVFFGTGAGIVWQDTGHFFKGTGCRPPDQIPPNWRRFADQCRIIVSIQAMAWALWGLYILLFVGTLIHKLKITTRPTPEGFYHNKV
ncbi:hypothetical protein D9611_010095 [Ephemerocybe angulata]|uniref:Uncharacterized protein n=2 Tax=Ephemerocybe angulata TaxID=980116 RepID=A0A8H6HZ09_9AGAR|nr:hypothetical protein D9611_010095 [Tulosesus angulatus]KAF6750059.1 hypothetical protein DFP72DRAFT_911683 [Tulosesus angulatus]KAF6755650.1 hypothetical protein DFP72DRAFT_1067455 [Tulosesus angulatus]